MKKYLLLLIAILFSSMLFADPNYNNGNGTIILEKKTDNINTIVRKCEVDVKIGDLLKEENRIIYDDYESKKIIGKLKDNDNVKVLQVCRREFPLEKKDSNQNVKGEVWYKIQKEKTVGWLCIYSSYLNEYSDPYYNNRYEIIEKITSSGKNWTVRSMDQSLSVWKNINIVDVPGTKGNNIIYTIKPGDEDPIQTNINIIAMTEEVETIENQTDHWLKVEYKNFTGWIFGGYATAERGGPKYYIPENTVQFCLGWY